MSESSKKPPSENQLRRIHELLGDERLGGEWLDSIGDRMTNLIQTSGGSGVLIGILKKKIKEMDERNL